jgi:hypothetical protein
MSKQKGFSMRKLYPLTITSAMIMMMSSLAMPQSPASGTLTVNATVVPSISLVFIPNPGGIPFNPCIPFPQLCAVTLQFGNVSAFGAIAAGITRSTTATTFTVSTPVDVLVTKANSASANYTLKAQLGAADAVNTWQVGGTTVTNAALSTLTPTGAYGSNLTEVIALTIPFTSANGTVISNNINFTATAN